MIGKVALLSLLALALGQPFEANSIPSLSAHDLCPKELTHFLLPHEYDCTLFYYCEYGMRYDEPTRCAPGTEFSAELQVCIHPAQANCNLPGVPPTEESDSENIEVDNTPEVPEQKPESEEQNPEIEEQKPEIDEITPKPVETQPESEEQKPESEEHEPEDEEGNPEPEEQQPEVEEQQPEIEEITPEPVEQKPEVEEQKPESEDQEPETEEVKPENVEQQPESEEQKPEQPETDEQKPEVEDQKPEPPKDLLPNGCPVDFHIHWLLPHESECNKFYYCNFGEKVLMTCAPGTYFNFKIQVCDWPENVGCANTDRTSEENNGNSGEDNGNSSENNGNSSETNGNSNENNGNSSEGSEGDGWLSNGCPADSNVNFLLPHKTECGKFYQCVHGQKVESDCPGGLHFNPAIQVCDWPENVGCANTDRTSEENNGNSGEDNGNNSENNGNSDENNGNSSENNGDSSENTGNSSENNGNSNEGSGGDGWLSNGCPADSNVNFLLPHKTECGKFYQCVHGQKVESDCPDGLHFNPAIQVCDWPQNVNCGNNGNSGETSGNTGNSGENENTGENNGSGEENNRNSEESNGNGEDNELLSNGCPADFNVNKLLPHKSDCGKYYYCVSGEKVEMECNSGLYFNPALQVCDWPENVNCSSNGEGSGSGEENSNGSEGSGGGEDNGNSGEDNENNGEDNGNSEENNSNGNEGSGSGEDNGSNGGDNGNSGENGIEVEQPNDSKCIDSCNTKPWAHAFACDKFWRCEGEKANLVVCSEGLFFNSKTGTCDFMCNVNCIRDHVQSSANAQGLKIFVPWNKVDDTIRKSYMPLTINLKK